MFTLYMRFYFYLFITDDLSLCYFLFKGCGDKLNSVELINNVEYACTYT